MNTTERPRKISMGVRVEEQTQQIIAAAAQRHHRGIGKQLDVIVREWAAQQAKEVTA